MKSTQWTARATYDLKKTTKFYSEIYGNERSRGIMLDLLKSTEILKKEPEIGAIDKTFTHLKQEYRKLIHHHCKINYRIGSKKIYIVRVFDTRQHPDKNK